MTTATRFLGFSTAHLMKKLTCPFPSIDLFFMLWWTLEMKAHLHQIVAFAPPGVRAFLSSAR
jgi:hypothetical protein